jgi:hypothetical protein
MVDVTYDRLLNAASAAAIELGNIRLRRRFRADSIARLADILAARLPAEGPDDFPSRFITPTVLLMSRVVRQRNPAARLDDVIADTRRLIAALRAVAAGPAQARDSGPDLLGELLADCLLISRHCAARRRPISV